MGFIFTPSIGINIAFHLYLRLGITIATVFRVRVSDHVWELQLSHSYFLGKWEKHIMENLRLKLRAGFNVSG